VLGPFPPDGAARTRALDLCLGPDRYTTDTLVAPGATDDATVAIAKVAVVAVVVGRGDRRGRGRRRRRAYDRGAR